MTWGEWVESNYSKNEYEIYNIEYIREIGDVGGDIVQYQSLPVFVTDAILANEVYKKGGSHGGGSN